MLLHKVPAVETPKPVIIGAAIFLAIFFFYFTRSAESSPKSVPSKGSPIT